MHSPNPAPALPFHLRQGIPSDVPALHKLIEFSVLANHGPFYTQEQTDLALQSIYIVPPVCVEDRTCFALVVPAKDSTSDIDVLISQDEIVVGVGAWTYRSKPSLVELFNPEVDPAKLTVMFVHPGWGRKGLAKLLLNACEQAAREKGFKRMEFIATFAGIGFYEKNGYRIIDKGDGKEGSMFKDAGGGVILEYKEMGKDLV